MARLRDAIPEKLPPATGAAPSFAGPKPVTTTGASTFSDLLVAKLSLAPDDVVVVKTAFGLSAESAARVRTYVGTALPPGQRIVVIDKATDLSVVGTAVDSIAPSVGRIVLVRTPAPIGGQREHAAIVTQVTGDTINVMLFPGEGEPYPISSVRPIASETAIGWRWPPRP